jgi:radical SAM protein with 4Fe4S-binding SPASM domain
MGCGWPVDLPALRAHNSAMQNQATAATAGDGASPALNFPTLYFESTRGCNLRCNICMSSSNDTQRVRESKRQEMSTDEIEELVLKTAKEVGVRVIIWSGGEFLTRKDSLDLLSRARKHGYRSSVCSNGLLLKREKILAIKEAAGDDVVLSLGINSLDDENESTRDAEVDLTIQALDLCEQLGVKRHVVVNLGRHNMESLGRTFDYLYQRRIPWNRSPFTARGSGAEHFTQHTLTPEEMEKHAHPEMRRHAFGYVSYTPFFLSPDVHNKFSQGRSNRTVPQHPSIGCWCGTWLAVNAEGYVAPCAILLDVLEAGNLREASFKEIIETSEMFSKILDRSQLEGKCGRCRYQYTCGGCRAMAYFKTGNYMAEDPQCFFEPVDKTTVSPHEAETNRVFEKYALMARYAGL